PVTVRHDQAMEKYRQALLPESFDSANLAQDPAPLGNEKVLSVVGIHIRCDHAVDGSGKLPVQTVGQHGFDHGAFEEPVLFFVSGGEFHATFLCAALPAWFAGILTLLRCMIGSGSLHSSRLHWGGWWGWGLW